MTELKRAKDKDRSILEYILLGLSLCVIALRTTFTEGPNIQSDSPLYMESNLYSLFVSGLLIFSFVLWLVWCFCGRGVPYRVTFLETGLCIFIAAAVLSCLAAANKRAAITTAASLASLPIMAVMLVQILDTQWKIRLVLSVIAALGAVCAWECLDQSLYSNQQLVEFYRSDPLAALSQQRIGLNTLQHWQFEHRLYTKGVRGFFTTSNSAGSFIILAFFAALALFLEGLKDTRSVTAASWRNLFCGVAAAAVLSGLLLTRSKGAIAAFLCAGGMFVVYLSAGNWLGRHRKAVLIGCVLSILAVSGLAVWYGLAYDRLPGGNSMLVRWQYWVSSVKMYTDHLLAGVGPGNFVYFYTHYKPDSAIEEVADPHNFPLSILTQYGPAGLVGFLCMIFLPLYKIISQKPALIPETRWSGQGLLTAGYMIVIAAILLAVRPVILKMPPASFAGEKEAAVVMLFIVPVVVFILGFLSLTAAGRTIANPVTGITSAALFCALSGVLVHNMIDFAIFEPGVAVTFWAVLACLVATDAQQRGRPVFPIPAVPVRILAAVLALAACGLYFNYIFVPAYKGTVNMIKAHRAAQTERFDLAHDLLAAAAGQDMLNPDALSFDGRLYLQAIGAFDTKRAELLPLSRDRFLEAIKRNDADFKNFEYLTGIYVLMSQTADPQAKSGLLTKAFDSAFGAVERYPGSSRLRMELADVAERLGKNDFAIEQYKKTIEIEDAFREQFRQMYPGQEVFSRFGEENYQAAKERLKRLNSSEAAGR